MSNLIVNRFGVLVEPPRPGVFMGISWEAYQGIPALNHSTLKQMGKSAAHAHYHETHPSRQTDAMLLGSATHDACLLPQDFGQRYCCRPEGLDRRTKQGKIDWEQFLADNVGRQPLTIEDYDLCMSMRASVAAHEQAERLIAKSFREVVLIWNDPGSGLLCKARIDGMTEDVTVLDLKTTTDASPEGFARSVARYGYDTQVAFYEQGLRVLGKPPRDFVLIPVEKDAPFAVACYRLGEVTKASAELKIRRWIKQYLTCKRSACWPSYTDIDEIMDIDVPAWALAELDLRTA